MLNFIAVKILEVTKSVISPDGANKSLSLLWSSVVCVCVCVCV